MCLSLHMPVPLPRRAHSNNLHCSCLSACACVCSEGAPSRGGGAWLVADKQRRLKAEDGFTDRAREHWGVTQQHMRASSQLSTCIGNEWVCVCIYVRSSLMDAHQWNHYRRLIYCFSPCSDYHHNSFFLPSTILPVSVCLHFHTCVPVCAPRASHKGGFLGPIL